MSVEIMPICAKWDADICQIIQQVGSEYGAIGDGFGPSDPEVMHMSQHYLDQHRSRYFVALLNGNIIGGGGIAPFGSDPVICELKKLFLLPESRGLGIGKQLVQTCLDYARHKNYHRCYLDTLSSMHSAIRLYEQFGFTHLSQPLTGTIHSGCDIWMLKDLREATL
ncbi:GNAT family N-acetyltransferase [Vibrio mangrovi]|uniref:Acetyltransferase (GNAT) family protein n=1 Tax=Vibrio mangrovi TaxID=474394 RepID=A0A1Y6IQ75_9VIBR|nr:GNAT family N-acetyltransferase [Vibrio mangrovi]MDW6004251.1 GNAT family N-acetyltransferase [Vibrio mangrovi]SMR98950.1 Acetyltransferase (GNAT) family protein [Vibrio mangrovi]